MMEAMRAQGGASWTCGLIRNLDNKGAIDELILMTLFAQIDLHRFSIYVKLRE